MASGLDWGHANRTSRCEVSRGSFNVYATARIDRTEFGITAARGLAARYLNLTMEIQCTRN